MKTLKYFQWLIICLVTIPLYSQERHQLELIVNTKETEGETVTFHLDKYYSGYLVWNPDGYITTDDKIVNPGDVTIRGDVSGTDYGWDGDCNSGYNPWMGRIEYYKLWVQGKNASVKVDCYGVDFNYPGVDFKVIYYYQQDKFRNVDSVQIAEIDLYDDPNGLQPTEPKNLTCTNPTQKGAHPHFTWITPDWPGAQKGEREALIVFYRVFRNGNLVDPEVYSESWTDENVRLHPNGNTFTYYVTAYLSHSPDSDPSNSVSIKGYLSKQDGGDQFQNPDSITSKDDALLVSTSAFPNPFNPSTTIQYELPKACQVNLQIFNLRGELVRTLVNGNQAAQRYQVVWAGKTDLGQTVAAGVYICKLQADDFNQTKRLILIK